MTVGRIRVSGAWLVTPRRVHTTSSNTSRAAPATGRWVIHDLGCGTGAMGRWLAPVLPGPQHWSCTTGTETCWCSPRPPSRPGR
jgi:hypothetical protein